MTFKTVILIAVIYFIVINIISSALAIADKRKARKEEWRISENTLMLFGLMGGAIGEYLTMKRIHHKTRHKKFMIGLPLEFLLHIIIVILIVAKVVA